MIGNGLYEGMSLGSRIKWAREHHPRKLTQGEVGAWFGLDQKGFQSVERGKSQKKAISLVPQLAKKLEIDEKFFWARVPQDPYKTEAENPLVSDYNAPKDYVDVDLHVPYHSGKVSITMNQIKKAKLAAGLARNNTFGVQIVDDDNIPRLKRGMIVFFEERSSYNDGDLVVFNHPTERIKGPDGRMHAVTLIRRYVLEGSTWRLKGQNPQAENYLAQGVQILGVAKVLRHQLAQGWYIDETNETQIPYEIPAVFKQQE